MTERKKQTDLVTLVAWHVVQLRLLLLLIQRNHTVATKDANMQETTATKARKERFL